MALANNDIQFIMLRFGIGFALATFVACQFWTASMFSVKIVGTANATTGGWGNLGGGVTQLLMPLIYQGLTSQYEPFEAWRWAFFIPGFFHIICGIGILFFSTDLPDGNYALLKRKGRMSKDSGWKMFVCGFTNYRCVFSCSFALSLFRGLVWGGHYLQTALWVCL
jgi:MFS transporter, NNP family, nitrate/nitrite transporter